MTTTTLLVRITLLTAGWLMIAYGAVLLVRRIWRRIVGPPLPVVEVTAQPRTMAEHRALALAITARTGEHHTADLARPERYRSAHRRTRGGAS